MDKFTANVNVVAGSVFTLIGGFVVWRLSAFLYDAPRGHEALFTWACLIGAVGIFLVISGVGRVLRGTGRMKSGQEQDLSEDN